MNIAVKSPTGYLGHLPLDSETIVLYEGAIILRHDQQLFQGRGKVEAVLLPKFRLKFSLHREGAVAPIDTSAQGDEATLEMVETNQTASVRTYRYVPRLASRREFGEVPKHIEGRLVSPTIFSMRGQDGTETLMQQVQFNLVNFQEYIGRSNCVTATFGPWSFSLNTLDDIDERQERRAERGGCTVTHLGELQRHDGSLFGAEEAQDALLFLYWVLSFANGGKCSNGLAAGFDTAGRKVWERWSAEIVDAGPPRRSWFPMNHPGKALALAEGAWKIWQDADKREWFCQVIGTYTDSTDPADPALQLAKAQIALEILAWVALVEERAVETAEDVDDMRAFERIRRVLGVCGIPLTIPSPLLDLSTAFSGKDGPQAATRIRNWTTHPTKANLADLRRCGANATFEAWLLSLWYVELVMLDVLGYNGPHENRTVRGGYVGGHELVPWAGGHSGVV